MTAISQKHPAEQQLKEALAKLMDKSHHDSAVTITKKLTQISLTVAKQKSQKLLDNLSQEYSKNTEQLLWKTCFYPAIETLRKINIEETRPAFVAFIEAAIHFYEDLIQKYESNFDVCYQEAMYWQDDSLPFLENSIGADKVNLAKFEGGRAKIALRSAQRHFLNVGDLHRYKALLNKTDFLESKCWYIKAVQANFSNGRSFNQLAVLAMQSKNFLDMVLHFVQALVTKYPFESARESLELVFNDIRNMAISNATDIYPVANKNFQQPHKKDRVNIKKPKTKLRAENKFQEIWIHSGNGRRKKELAEIESLVTRNRGRLTRKTSMDIKLQKQAIIYLLHTVGILITNISMEDFFIVSESSIKLVGSLLASENSLATPATLFKLTLVEIFAAHHVKKGITTTMAETQQKYALHYLLQMLSLFLEELLKDMHNLGLYLLTGKASDRLERVLPSISTLCSWLTSPATNNLLKISADSDLPDKSSAFVRLADVATKLSCMSHQNQLLKTNVDCGQLTVVDNKVVIYLPELVVSSCFHNIFPSQPQKLEVHGADPNNLVLPALHARLYSIIVAAEHLASLNLYLSKREHNNQTVFEAQKPLSTVIKANKENTSINVGGLKNIKNDQSSQEELDELLIKQLVMDQEESSSRHKWVLEVLPQYLIPDTNTFVDHLAGLIRIVDSKQFTVLVPTTVIAELSSLCLNASSAHSFLSSEMLLGNNTQLKYVIKQAKATMDYLKAAAGERERIQHLATITSNGNILPKLSFAYEMTDCGEKMTNDDRILAACVALADKQPRSLESNYHNQTTKIKRHLVFLTEDRALSIKASAAKIPVRTVPEFLKWAEI